VCVVLAESGTSERTLTRITFTVAATSQTLAQEFVGEAEAGEKSLFEIGRSAGAPLETACVGKGTCGLCRIKVTAGAAVLSAVTEVEIRHIGNMSHLTGLRLACQTRLLENAASDIAATVITRRPKK